MTPNEQAVALKWAMGILRSRAEEDRRTAKMLQKPDNVTLYNNSATLIEQALVEIDRLMQVEQAAKLEKIRQYYPGVSDDDILTISAAVGMMCSQAGRDLVEHQILKPFGYSLDDDRASVFRENRNLKANLDIVDAMSKEDTQAAYDRGFAEAREAAAECMLTCHRGDYAYFIRQLRKPEPQPQEVPNAD